jgi:hypothetical protein
MPAIWLCRPRPAHAEMRWAEPRNGGQLRDRWCSCQIGFQHFENAPKAPRWQAALRRRSAISSLAWAILQLSRYRCGEYPVDCLKAVHVMPSYFGSFWR